MIDFQLTTDGDSGKDSGESEGDREGECSSRHAMKPFHGFDGGGDISLFSREPHLRSPICPMYGMYTFLC